MHSGSRASPRFAVATASDARDKQYKLTKLLVNVNIQNSLGPVNLVMSPENTVGELIRAAIEIYVKEKRRPLLNRSDPLCYELHYSQFSMETQAWRVLIRDGECGQRIVPIMNIGSELPSQVSLAIFLSNTSACLMLSDIPMTQFIINMNASLPQSQKFIIHVLDNTHLFVRSDMAGMIRSAISDFRDANTYEKPA
ncbi:hypothetical protein KY290_034768 [Solanum tuberosum]|uniref:General transcription and DNA repair factor IIH subunit TFB5 n=1 Tax=Solanum tuberosum TaxID=4113 RepID=A0ABQ7U7Q1_SOLTU|nr:hypothetical protein KY289_034951 [Solanum tuberosum]KAH0741725.1 hypothetical protein KY290_034768 [Solanum tuberosum]